VHKNGACHDRAILLELSQLPQVLESIRECFRTFKRREAALKKHLSNHAGSELASTFMSGLKGWVG
jgi:hypothetical protein